MDEYAAFTLLNDYLFCPASIYFHRLYDDVDPMLYKCEDQLRGSVAHRHVDSVLSEKGRPALNGATFVCDRYKLRGKIDRYYADTHELVEYKRHVSKVNEGYVFQMYAQYFALVENGYRVSRLRLHSFDDNKDYDILLPEEDKDALARFESLVGEIHGASPSEVFSAHADDLRCMRCIYSKACVWGPSDS